MRNPPTFAGGKWLYRSERTGQEHAIELYHTARYIALTGIGWTHCGASRELEDGTKALGVLLERSRKASTGTTPKEKKPRDAALPGDRFSSRADLELWKKLLEPKGWVLSSTAEFEGRQVGYWIRPGKKADKEGGAHSANTGRCVTEEEGDELFHVFSPNAAPFHARRSYSAFTVLARLHFDGDYSAAARALATKERAVKKQKGG